MATRYPLFGTRPEGGWTKTVWSEPLKEGKVRSFSGDEPLSNESIEIVKRSKRLKHTDDVDLMNEIAAMGRKLPNHWKEPKTLPEPKKLAWNEVCETGDRYRPFMEGRVSVGWGWWKRWVEVVVWRR